MTHATISLIYGEQVVDDLEFCTKHNEVIERYSHGIMTLRLSPRKELEAVALNPASIPGWTHSLEMHPEDCGVLQEFFARLISHYVEIGNLAGQLETRGGGSLNPVHRLQGCGHKEIPVPCRQLLADPRSPCTPYPRSKPPTMYAAAFWRPAYPSPIVFPVKPDSLQLTCTAGV